MTEECPYCDVKMVDKTEKNVPVEQCPKCGFSSVAEENIGLFKQRNHEG